MLLCDKTILKYLDENKISIHPFDSENLGPSSYDLTLAKQIAVFPTEGDHLIDPHKEIEMNTFTIKQNKHLVIKPNQLVLGSTKEYIELPGDIAARIEGRSSLARLGVVIHSTGGFVDAGFKGNLTLEMSNLGDRPVKLYYGMRIAQLTFIKQDGCSKYPYDVDGKYQHQKETTKSRIYQDFRESK